MFYIYEIKHKQTGIKYIGYSKNTKARWREHRKDLRNNKHHSQYLQRAWDKYGEDLFEFNTVETYISLDEVKAREKYLIEQNTGGFNVASGGTGGNTRAGMTKEQAEAYSLKQSDAQKRRYQDPAERQKANCFANLTEEQRRARLEKWSNVKQGRNNASFIYDKQVLQIDPKTGAIAGIWEDACSAGHKGGFNSGYIIKCCKGKKGYNTHKGFVWKWAE